ncbi:MAG: DUF1819 family protein [Ignavibacteria bacterium]|nr:DUF1819 family protein [Ignavibacteria bacterium]
MISKKKYSFSFTAASALIPETLIIAEEYDKLKDWKAVQKSLLENNLLNKIKQSTFKREYSEIKKRLSLLTQDQFHLMTTGSLDETKSMILLSLAKTYKIFNDFIVEVIRNKYIMFDRVLSEVDYNRFIDSKSLTHPELSSISEETLKKVKQVIFKLLEQAGLITNAKNGTILKPILSNESFKVIIKEDPRLLTTFLFSNSEIKSILNKEVNAKL